MLQNKKADAMIPETNQNINQLKNKNDKRYPACRHSFTCGRECISFEENFKRIKIKQNYKPLNFKNYENKNY